MAFYIVSEETD